MIQIGPLLIGLTQAAYQALTRTEARDYRKLKDTILYCLKISPETYHQNFWAQKGMERLRPCLFAQNLRDLAERWLQPITQSIEEAVDLIVLEPFLTNLRGNTQGWVRQHQLKTVEEALRLVEDYIAMEADGEGPRKDHPRGTRTRICPDGPKKERKERHPEL